MHYRIRVIGASVIKHYLMTCAWGWKTKIKLIKTYSVKILGFVTMCFTFLVSLKHMNSLNYEKVKRESHIYKNLLYICVCVYIYTHTHVCIYIYIHTHTHTHTHIYIYIYIYIHFCKTCSKYCMYSFGYFPGVRLLFADVSEPSISSIFKGWM